jgi:acyl-CoA hydrolase
VFVAIDEEERPVPVPPFVPETEAEREEYAAAQERRKKRLGK